MTGIFCVSPLSLPSAFTSLPSLSSPYLPSLISTSPSHCSSPTLPSYPLPFPLPLHPPLLALPSLPPLPSPSFVPLPPSSPSHFPSPRVGGHSLISPSHSRHLPSPLLFLCVFRCSIFNFLKH